ncbi:MAG: hypothetical protein SFY92_03340 [Verrucomicrobiae bacterium]|nr:hypothetical protein [Verrucomicrobiae bacterium]
MPLRSPLSLLLLGTAALLAGCVSRPNIPVEKYSLPASEKGPAAEAHFEGTLAVHRVSVSPQFQNRNFTYRISEFGFESDAYHTFFAPPGQVFSQPLRSHLRAAGLFTDVVSRNDDLGAKFFMTAEILELYGDFRPGKPSAAVLKISFLVYTKDAKNFKNPFYQGEYLESVPLRGKSGDQLMQAWNRALEKIVSRLAADLSETPPPAPSPSIPSPSK